MERERSLKLKKDWAKKTCFHPAIETELYLGRESGNKVCSVCGQTIYSRRVDKNTRRMA
ncbi:MAG: hypothetical protein M3R27_04290 [Bacteroidota bacterium]|nr:hypothetical protein [Bacteroidota bacterium]